MPKRSRSYKSWQLDKLSNPELAAGYLNSALSDSSEMFLIALRKVAQARQMSRVAKEANVQRETLYRALSEEGNPTLSTLRSVLEVLGMDLAISSKSEKDRENKDTLGRLFIPKAKGASQSAGSPFTTTSTLADSWHLSGWTTQTKETILPDFGVGKPLQTNQKLILPLVQEETIGAVWDGRAA